MVFICLNVKRLPSASLARSHAHLGRSSGADEKAAGTGTQDSKQPLLTAFCCSPVFWPLSHLPAAHKHWAKPTLLCQNQCISGTEAPGSSHRSLVQNCFVAFKLLRFPCARHPCLAWMYMPKFCALLQYQPQG